ncbi:hypothetical protein [Nocardia sp. NPDC052112]|uniref:hypothetical protein n=1 Tax=Nocardia sp. NPDC052112 TaxID=3155646 RepID=UPI003434EE68
MNGLTWLRAEFRQHRYHRAFRIAAPMWDEPGRERLRQLLATADTQVGAPLDERALADAATNVWRAERKLRKAPDWQDASARQARRYLTQSRDALAAAELVVQEHDGDVLHPGRSLDVLAYQDDPTVSEETVTETVRPTVYFQNRRIQLGQVIVGRPVGDRADLSEAE